MKLKICGLKTAEDVAAVNAAAVDYAGFVFAPSPQQIDVARARALKAALRPDIKAVGVFVDESAAFIAGLVAEGVIDMVQFHGGAEYPMPCSTIRAFRIRGPDDIKDTRCDFVLFDAYHAGAAGATGRAFDWRLIGGYTAKPFFLAGGIDSGNAAAAASLKPYAIDISSGVEENGKKSLQKIKEVLDAIKIW